MERYISNVWTTAQLIRSQIERSVELRVISFKAININRCEALINLLGWKYDRGETEAYAAVLLALSFSIPLDSHTREQVIELSTDNQYPASEWAKIAYNIICD